MLSLGRGLPGAGQVEHDVGSSEVGAHLEQGTGVGDVEDEGAQGAALATALIGPQEGSGAWQREPGAVVRGADKLHDVGRDLDRVEEAARGLELLHKGLRRGAREADLLKVGRGVVSRGGGEAHDFLPDRGVEGGAQVKEE